MRKLSLILALFIFTLCTFAQSPQKLSYQAVVRNAGGTLVKNSNVGIRVSILQGSASGTQVYTETHIAITNSNGLLSLDIGTGTSTGNFSDINWANGPYYLKTETDPAGGTNYSITGVSQLLSVPYALYAQTAGNGWPVVQKDTILSTQTWIVPSNVSKIKVELWGASGGGGGAGAHSYSWNLVNGGNGGSGGFASQELLVTPSQQFDVLIGELGSAGLNATWHPYGWSGDTDGGDGGDTYFGPVKAAGGTGGQKGSSGNEPVNGVAGTANIGTITGYSENPWENILNVFQGLPRSYIADRYLTSKPGKGGSISSYSASIPATSGERGCAIITIYE